MQVFETYFPSQTQQVNTQTGFPDQKSDLPLESDKSTNCYQKVFEIPLFPLQATTYRHAVAQFSEKWDNIWNYESI